MKKIYPFLISVIALACFSSCNNSDDFLTDIDDIEEGSKEKQEKPHALEIVNIELEDGGADIVVYANLADGKDTLSLEDGNLYKIKGTEYGLVQKRKYNTSLQPSFKEAVPLARQAVEQKNLHIDIIVDLAMAQEYVDVQQNEVRKICRMFPEEYCNLVFTDESGIISVEPATKYAINRHFIASGKRDRKFLYANLESRINDFLGESPDSAGNRIILMFSDGRVFTRSNAIMDPEFYSRRERITGFADEIKRRGGTIYYASIHAIVSPNEVDDEYMMSICQMTDGLFMETFSWQQMEDKIFSQFDMNRTDYRLVFSNPKNKVYHGLKHQFVVECLDMNDNVVVDGDITFSKGAFYHPIVVGGRSQAIVIVQGTLWFLGLFILVYLVCQIVIPRIRFEVFKRKYVRQYTGDNMSVNGILTGSECYYCKAPFVKGDEIVVKCKHAMHKQCWDENGYHCPEYGRNCKTGSHYYNPNNILDYGNAGYYMMWLLSALFAGFLSWVILSCAEGAVSANFIKSAVLKFFRIKESSPEAVRMILEHINNLSLLPSFGLWMGFLLSIAISSLTVHRRSWKWSLLEIFGRGMAGALVGYLTFFIGCIVTIIMNMDNSYIVNWLVWTGMGYLLALVSTFGTKIKVRGKWLLFFLLLGGIMMIVWNLLFVEAGIDYRVSLLICHLMFAVGISMSVVQDFPKSLRYFFHVGGAMKEMDIAVYKWFEANTNRVATIGRSVDCDLVMSWDTAGDIAPLQANISRDKFFVYITPLEDGVMMKGRSLPVGKPERLYHGKKFIIGKTEFQFVERDV